MTQRINIIATGTIPEGKLQDAKNFCSALIENTVEEQDCLQYEVFISPDNTQFTVIETYKNQAAFDLHMERLKESGLFDQFENYKLTAQFYGDTDQAHEHHGGFAKWHAEE
eukprot:TRINITY_DN277_c0_g1_i1.p1 TRINITY_DN277_c0_g1~~TRINITY_DN277_c0_g1_i1.p1  ORF type:complete len:111 (-),score=29.31 TRINITY_DN277_c0_g1_i1:64-396(-)